MSTARRRADKNTKEKYYKLGKCRDCGSICEIQSSPRCNKHRRWQQVRMIRNRWFYSLFT